MLVRVLSSPYEEDYDSSPPPWDYSGGAFKNWVYEVFLESGKSGRYPKNVNEAVNEAVEIVQGAGFKIERA